MSKFTHLAARYIARADVEHGGGLRLVFDIEANGLLDTATTIHCVVIAELDSDQVNEYGPDQIGAALEHLARADYLVGHNIAGYDLPLLHKLHQWMPACGCTIVDTLVVARLIMPNISDLDDKAAAMGSAKMGKLRGRYSIEAFGIRLGIPKVGVDIEDWSKWTPEMQARCVGDISICKALWQFLQPDGYSQGASDLEHRTAAICNQITTDGAPFDSTAAKQLQQTWEARCAEIAATVQEQLPDLKLTSRQQIGELLEFKGWIPDKRTPTGKPSITNELLEVLPEQFPDLAGVGEYLLLRQRLGSLAYGDEAWIKHAQTADGRIHAPLLHIGQPHYRASTFKPNMHSVPNSKKGSAYGDECRSLFCAPAGWSMVAADQANLQDRALAHYLHAFDGGRLSKAFTEGGDQHWPNAIALGLVAGGTARDKESKLHTALREGAKRFRYAFLFGSGTERLGTIIYDIVRSAQRIDPNSDLLCKFFGNNSRPTSAALKRAGTMARKRFLDGTPGLEALQSQLHKYVDRQGWIRGLDGRRLPLRSQHTALNYLLVCAEAIICKHWLVQVHDELCSKFRYGWDGDVVICLWVHDELVACCRSEIADQVGEILVRHAKEAGKYYDLKVPLDAEYKIGTSWAGESSDHPKTEPIVEVSEIPPAVTTPKSEIVEPESDDSIVEVMPWEGPSMMSKGEPPAPVKTDEVDDIVVNTLDSKIDQIRALFLGGGATLVPEVATSKANGHDREHSDGSRAEAAHDTYAEVNAGKPFNDGFMRTQGYRLAKVFDYTLPDGTVLYQQNRYELRDGITPTTKRPRKKFLPHRGDILGAGDRLVIYNWPAVMCAGPGSTVFVTEGEKNADALIKAGLLATTVLSHKWTPECASALVGYDIIILEDHDDDGRKQSAIAHKTLSGGAASIRIVSTELLWKHLPSGSRDIKAKDDVEDWIELGGDPAKLVNICREVLADGTRLVFIDMSRWDYEPVPEQEWAVFNRIPLRQCTLFSGEGGAGKSLTQLHLSVATVLERDWLGVVPEPGRALFIDAEDDEKVLHFRLKAIAAHYDTDITTMIERGLHLVSWVGYDSTLATVSRNGKIEPTPLYSQLLEAAGDIKPTIIGIAAAANVFAGNENDRSHVQQFVGLLTRVAMVANGSLVLVSHPSLTGISSESGLSGSTQWHNSVRARSLLRGIKPEAGEPVNNDLREIVFKKNNYGPVSESIKLHWDSGLFLPIAGEAFDRAAQETTAREVFLSLLKRFRSANRNLSDRVSVSYAPSVFAGEDEAKRAGLTKKNLANAMAQLFKDGLIWNEPCGRATRSGFRLAPKP
jgi:RecA-family ATPase/DNA polymerase I-like protein with 3'-5' exonuclease and polymerase domains